MEGEKEMKRGGGNGEQQSSVKTPLRVVMVSVLSVYTLCILTVSTIPSEVSFSVSELSSSSSSSSSSSFFFLFFSLG